MSGKNVKLKCREFSTYTVHVIFTHSGSSNGCQEKTWN